MQLTQFEQDVLKAVNTLNNSNINYNSVKNRLRENPKYRKNISKNKLTAALSKLNY